MATHESGILLAERHVERDARAAAFLRGRNERGAFAQDLAHRRAELRVQHRGGVFELAVLADGPGLAVALRAWPLDTQRRNGARGEQLAQFLADVHERREILHVAAG